MSTDSPDNEENYDSSKIQNKLGWYPKFSFENGIRKTVLWYIENISWSSNLAFNKK